MNTLITKHGKIKKIAVIRFSSLGDIILTLPVIKMLEKNFPMAKIDFIVKEQYMDLLKNCSSIHQIFALPKSDGHNLRVLWNLTEKVKAKHYDLLLDLHGNPRSLFLSLFSGAKIKARYKKSTIQRRLLVKFKYGEKKFKHTSEKYAGPLRAMGIPDSLLAPELTISDNEISWAKEFLGKTFSNNKKRLIALGPGARHFTKRWPLQKFLAVAQKLTNENHPSPGLIILGDDQDNLQVPEVNTIPGDHIINLAGELSITRTAAILKHMQLLITNDTGLMHLATAVKTPVLAIFGPTSRELGFFPMGDRARVIEKQLPCRPCSLHGSSVCPITTFECMESISVDEVYAQAIKLLQPHTLELEDLDDS